NTWSRMDITQVLRKKNFSKTVLKTIALETINTRYLQPNWLHVCTYGSRLNQDGSGGTGIFSELFAFYLNLVPDTSSFDGEIEAVRNTIQ
ncbi:hypothetical protein TNIN_183251, partial [Trichonephila inaurata madagascariensis]